MKLSTSQMQKTTVQSSHTAMMAKYPLFWLTPLVLFFSLHSVIPNNYGPSISWAIIFVWTLRGTKESLQGLLVSMLLMLINPNVFALHPYASYLRWLILLVACLQVAKHLPKNKLILPRWVVYVAILSAYLFFTSILISFYPTLSILRLVAYVLGIFAIYGGILVSPHVDWLTILATFGITVTWLSIPLIFVSQGYSTHQQFMGIINQPQLYGCIIVLPLTSIVGKVIWNDQTKISPFTVLSLVLMITTIALSSARTSYFSFIIAFTTVLFLDRAKAILILKKIIESPLTYLGLAFFVTSLFWFDPRQLIDKFVFERNVDAYSALSSSYKYESTLWWRLIASRVTNLETSWENFLFSPWFGIGFGVPTEFRLTSGLINEMQLLNIPVSLSMQKGFIGTAVLEETGVIGFTIFVLLISSQIKVVIRKSNWQPYTVLFLVAFLVNFGDSAYFAMGATGLLIHFCIGIALLSLYSPTSNGVP